MSLERLISRVTFKSSAIAGGKALTAHRAAVPNRIRNHFLILPNRQALKADSHHQGAL